ncbi:TPA: hypothetical protein ACX4IQ_005304 [Klebsiella pneumoniae]
MLINNKVKKRNKGKKKEGVQNILDVQLHRKEISRTYCTSPTLVIWDTIAGIS